MKSIRINGKWVQVATESVSNFANGFGEAYAKAFPGWNNESTKNGKMHDMASNASTADLLKAAANYASIDATCDVLGQLLEKSRTFRTMDILGLLMTIAGKNNVHKILADIEKRAKKR